MTPHDLRAVCLAACPELAGAFALAERVAGLNPVAEGIGPLVGEARAIINGHSPRDELRDSHKQLQDRLAFMWTEYGAAMADSYPGAARYTREALETARRVNP
jgi:hypothetical protein